MHNLRIPRPSIDAWLSTAGRPQTWRLIWPLLGATLVLLGWLWLSPHAGIAGSPTFAAQTDFPAGNMPWGVALGDLNADGKPELAAANRLSGDISVLRNTTADGAAVPTFAAKVDLAIGSATTAVSMADINADGKPDLVAANYSNLNIAVLINTTASGGDPPSFAAPVYFSTGHYNHGLAVGDLNADGKPDLVTANLYNTNATNGTTVSVLRNTTTAGGAPTFAAKVDFEAGVNPQAVAIGDLNGDGMPDLAVANNGGGSVSVLRSTTSPGAAPSFAAALDFAAGSSPTAAVIADLNADGQPDLAVANSGSGNISVFRNLTPGGTITPSFAAKADFTSLNTPTGLVTADINGDGRPDLVSANVNQSGAAVLLNTANPGGALTFASALYFSTGQYPQAVAAGDINRDGKPDLATVNQGPNTASALLNTSTADLALTQSAVPAVVRPGGKVVYSLQLSNAGGWPASGVVITSALPVSSLTGINVSSSGVAITQTSAAPVFTWQVQNLNPDQGGVITLTGVVSLTALTPQLLTNRAGVSGAGADANLANNQALASVQYRPFEIYLPLVRKPGP